MTTTVTGFDGTIDESTFSRGQALATHRGVVADRSSFNASQVANARSVRLTGGSAMDAGVLLEVTDSTAATVPIDPPQAGQWFLIVIRRDWDKNAVTYAVVPGDTTSTVTPTAPPAALPAINNRPGVMADQPLWWAWALTGSTNLLLIDARRLAAGIERRGTAAQRQAYYGPEPTTPAARRALQGATWFNTTTNLNEVYMTVYNEATNPGGIRLLTNQTETGVPGWYSVGTTGTDLVASTRSADFVKLPAGVVTTMDTLTLKLDQGRFLEFESSFVFYSLGNSAGTMGVYLDNRYLGDAFARRVHSQGGPLKYGPATTRYRLWVPAGTHVIDVRFSSEAQSVEALKLDAWTHVRGVPA